MQVCLASPFCRVSLSSCQRAECSQRWRLLCSRPVFAFLAPGEYCLRAAGSGRECRVLLRLPPGANLTVGIDCTGRVQWHREAYHCLYNLE